MNLIQRIQTYESENRALMQFFATLSTLGAALFWGTAIFNQVRRRRYARKLEARRRYSVLKTADRNAERRAA